MNDLLSSLPHIMTTGIEGSVVNVSGTVAMVGGFPAPVGSEVSLERPTGQKVYGQVVGFEGNLTAVCPYDDLTGLRHGSRVRLLRSARYIQVGEGLLGRVVDARGLPLDQRPAPSRTQRMPLSDTVPPALERPPIDEVLPTGVRVIDSMLTCGRGQRVGVFSGSGVGKSVTLGMMARNTAADVNVIAMIGERGREVNEFLQRDLGPEGLAKSVVVVATSDAPALLRVQAAFTATAIAEYFRDRGKAVLLMMDSLTRFAMAQREIGLAAGEPPATRGYPPSVFSLLPKLVERAGRTRQGSITGFYSVLVEGDDTNEPVSDAVRGLLDGHIVLSRDIASKGHYPAVDVLESISRVMPSIVTEEHQRNALAIREALAVYRDHDDLISIGAYRPGTNPSVDAAIRARPNILRLLQQGMKEATPYPHVEQALQIVANECRTAPPSQHAQPQAAPPVTNDNSTGAAP